MKNLEVAALRRYSGRMLPGALLLLLPAREAR